MSTLMASFTHPDGPERTEQINQLQQHTSSARRRRTTDQEEEEEDMFDEGHNVPLVRQRIESLEVLREDEDTSCWSNTWKAVASLLLTTMLIGPRAYSSYENHLAAAATDVPAFLAKADALQCAKNLDISFSKLYLEIKNERKNVCQGDSPGVCSCTNPTIPLPQDKWADQWLDAYHRNVDMAQSAPSDPDVVLLGDSITEHWLGVTLSSPVNRLAGVTDLWEELFGGGHGIPLGVSGDKCPQLLWRMQNGEIPTSLNPKAFWILIGSNDYFHECNREAILVGNLAVLGEGLRRKPNAKFVLQGLIPRGGEALRGSRTWESFTWINERLECLTQALPQQLSFFDGTDVVVTSDGGHINQTILYDYTHPSLEGYRQLGPAMIEHLKDIDAWTE